MICVHLWRWNNFMEVKAPRMYNPSTIEAEYIVVSEAAKEAI